MGWLDRLFKRNTPSKHVAKERLQLVLRHDRMKLPPGMLAALKDDLIRVISNYVEIDEAGISVELNERNSRRSLVASIPVVGTRRKKD